MVYNYSFHTCSFGIISQIKKGQWFKSRFLWYPISNHKNQIEAKDTRAMLYQTTCLLVVGSPSFWNAPNSTWASKSGSIPAKTSLNKVLAPCQMCPKKKSKAKEACPKVNQPPRLLRKTPFGWFQCHLKGYSVTFPTRPRSWESDVIWESYD